MFSSLIDSLTLAAGSPADHVYNHKYMVDDHGTWLWSGNQGNLVLADGVSLEQMDLDGFAQFGSECKTCMYWWNEGITAELPALGN